MVDRINKSYQKLCERSDAFAKILDQHKIKFCKGFYNLHSSIKNGKPRMEYYPIPVFTIKNFGDVVFDFKMNFIELTFSKKEILDFNFGLLNNNFAVYGYQNFNEDLYFGNLDQMFKSILNSKEKNFHIGMEFPIKDSYILNNYIKDLMPHIIKIKNKK